MSYSSLTPYELHKKLINHYVLSKKGSTAILQRDTSRDKRDKDVIRENHKFVWEDEDIPTTWEEKLAKKYYDKLFKEYCISDLSRYKENKFAMRWQTEPEMIAGKGQFVCGSKNCLSRENLRTWEVNFSYMEHGIKRNTLVKLRLCPRCSSKLNYKTKRKEIKRGKRKLKKLNTSIEKMIKRTADSDGDKPDSTDGETSAVPDEESKKEEQNIWSGPQPEEIEVSREEEFEKYLEELLL